MSRTLTAGPFRLRQVSYVPGMHQAWHYHDHPSVTLLLAGAIRETVRTQDEVAGALSVVVKPAGVVHADRVGPEGARTLQIGFNHTCCRDLERVGIGLGEWRWLHQPDASRAFLALVAALRCADSSQVTDPEGMVLDALGSLPPARPPGGGAVPGWLLRVRQHLDDAGKTLVATLAQEAGVHPGYLARAFRRHFGQSITDYRRGLRVRRAAEAIAGTGQVLARVAHDAGYADQPHLCREFLRATGMTPSAFRTLALG